MATLQERVERLEKKQEEATLEEKQDKCTHSELRLTIEDDGCVDLYAVCIACNKTLRRYQVFTKSVRRAAKKIHRLFVKS